MSPSTSPLKKALQTHLSNRALTSSLRTLTLTPPTSVDFSSNDFLSLSTSALLKHAFHTELASASDPTLGVGSRGSRLLDGNSEYAESLEKEIADFHHAPAGLLFNSGFDGNAGFFACVPQPGDVVLYDEFIHASVHEGMRLSRAGACVPFRHNCVSDLERRIEELNGKDESVRGGKKNIFVAVESLYSMDGDLSPLRRIVEVVERTLPGGNGHVIVDEAHSTGVYGEKGRGIVCMLGLEKRVFARLHTFGKALGCNGSIILCDDLTRSYLINYARPLIYTTSMSFPSLAAIRASYSLLKSGATEPLCVHLRALIQHLFTHLQKSPLVLTSSSSPPLLIIPPSLPLSPIFSLLTPYPRRLAKHCQDSGFMVRPIVSPTVPAGTERVRVCLHAGNSVEDVDGLVKAVAEWVRLGLDGDDRKQIKEVKARM